MVASDATDARGDRLADSFEHVAQLGAGRGDGPAATHAALTPSKSSARPCWAQPRASATAGSPTRSGSPRRRCGAGCSEPEPTATPCGLRQRRPCTRWTPTPGPEQDLGAPTRPAACPTRSVQLVAARRDQHPSGAGM